MCKQQDAVEWMKPAQQITSVKFQRGWFCFLFGESLLAAQQVAHLWWWIWLKNEDVSVMVYNISEDICLKKKSGALRLEWSAVLNTQNYKIWTLWCLTYMLCNMSHLHRECMRSLAGATHGSCMDCLQKSAETPRFASWTLTLWQGKPVVKGRRTKDRQEWGPVI